MGFFIAVRASLFTSRRSELKGACIERKHRFAIKGGRISYVSTGGSARPAVPDGLRCAVPSQNIKSARRRCPVPAQHRICHRCPDGSTTLVHLPARLASRQIPQILCYGCHPALPISIALHRGFVGGFLVFSSLCLSFF